MQIEVEITEQDHAAFYKAYGFLHNWLRRGLYLLLAALVISFYVQGGSDNLVWGIYILKLLFICLLLFPFFFVIPYYRNKSKFEKAFMDSELPFGIKTFKPFAVGVDIEDETGTRFLRSGDIKKVSKAGSYIFIILMNDDYYILPAGYFSSDREIKHFISIVNSGVAKERTGNYKANTGFSAPVTFKPGYLIGLLCLIPLIGGITGVVLVILGLVHYKDKVFVIIGCVGILITVGIYGGLFYTARNNSGFVKTGFATMTQTQLNDLVKNIEFYKMQNGSYPDSLQQLDTSSSYMSIYDTMSAIDNKQGKESTYNYQKLGTKYKIFSVGIDGIAGTKDDIYPNLMTADTSKLGFIRK